MKHQATAELFRYWTELRGERTAPERNDIDPGAIRDVLADTFMLEFDPDNGFPFRLTGTRVNALFDAEQKGRPFLEIWTAAERRNLLGVLLTVANGPCPVVAGATAAPSGQEPCSFELLLLPMRHHGQTHSRILGLIKPVTTPPWLGLLPIGPMKLNALRVLDEAPRAEPRERAPTPQRLAARLRQVRNRSSKHPALRVIEGGLQAARSNIFEVEVEDRHL